MQTLFVKKESKIKEGLATASLKNIYQSCDIT